MSLSTQTSAIAWGRASRDRGVPPAGVERGFWALLKEGKAFPNRPWKEAVACWSSAAQRWTSAELDTALRELLAADVAAKEARVSSEEQLLTSLVLALCAAFIVWNETLANWQATWFAATMAMLAVTLLRVRAAPG